MSDPIQFVMVGGFLGAGKTTLIAKLAQKFQAEGKHVCVVTNDQAAGLVDTELLRSQGLEVNEVAGSCFCCNFNGLTDAMDEFDRRQRPDVILAEPVGSCTDLIATIAMPMMERLGGRFVHSPYAVLLKPSHGLRILSGQSGGFSPKAEYIFRKQLEEAEIVLLNRIDELSAEEVQRLTTYIHEQYPGREVIGISARTGENVDAVFTSLHRIASPRDTTMEVDYDVYAAGEAELGWLNCTCTLGGKRPIALDAVATDLVEQLRTQLLALNAEPAHLKVLCSSDGNTSVANLVSSDSSTFLSVSSDSQATEVKVLVNARVCLTPEALTLAVRTAIQTIADQFEATADISQLESFRPGRPVPTHRITR
ncbi:CobW-like GTP-binding protein [Aureliella helgolandensis]|uniref:Putative GTP-binding protein YjiA n=1 Tax=Aureliella helgolandensis TaxID=2527968 RepID=A0A518G9W3_9BACT|nr:CobW-like GTP-binding protein [Aureliella helgolandensis]QDV25388.1 putative GTP-binding protein YjiA [Aureliella helgolandensis]